MPLTSLAVLLTRPCPENRTVAIGSRNARNGNSTSDEKKTADKPADNKNSGVKTWRDFYGDVAVLAGTLASSPANRWALCFGDSYHFAVAFMALSHSGKILVLPGNLQPGALAELACHYDAILHDGSLSSLPEKALVQLPLAGGEPVSLAPLDLKAIRLTLFTSGSSGTPKAITKTLDLLHAELEQLEHRWGNLLLDSRVESTVSHQHIYGLLFRVLWPLCSGRPFARTDLVYPEQVTAETGTRRVLISSPALLKRLAGQPSTRDYNAVFSSGGPLPTSAADDCETLLGLRPFEVFGSTETGGMGYRQQTEASTPWQLFDDIKTRLDDNNCLAIQSPYICRDTWYQTADICELHDNGRFTLKGRADRVVKIEEKRVSLAEIEQRTCGLEWVEEAAAFTMTQNGRLQVAAVVVLSPSGQEALAHTGKGKLQLVLRKALRQWLEPIAIPKRWRLIKEIPQNSQGKRLQREIAQLFLHESQAMSENKAMSESKAISESQATPDSKAMPERKPSVINVDALGNRVELTLKFDPAIEDFKGHFPQYPLLPGVSQIDLAVGYARKYLSVKGEFGGMEVIKFQDPILPDSTVTLTLNWHPDKRKLHFSYQTVTSNHSSGRVILGADA